MKELEMALEEYNVAMEHFEKFSDILGGIGVQPINLFSQLYEDRNSIHIFTGIEKIAEILGSKLESFREDGREDWRKLDYGKTMFFEIMDGK